MFLILLRSFYTPRLEDATGEVTLLTVIFREKEKKRQIQVQKMRARGRATKINTKNVMQRVPFKSTKLKKSKREKRDDIFTHTHSFSETAHVFRVVVVVTKQKRTKTITKKINKPWQIMAETMDSGARPLRSVQF